MINQILQSDSQICRKFYYFCTKSDFKIVCPFIFDILAKSATQVRVESTQRMKISWNRTTLIVGATVLGLMAIDSWSRIQSISTGGQGWNEGPLIAAEGVAAIFLLGLVAGLVAGIGIFFVYLLRREKLFSEQEEVTRLLDEVRESENYAKLIRNESSSEEEEDHAETLEPWERPVDWWKNADDE